MRALIGCKQRGYMGRALLQKEIMKGKQPRELFAAVRLEYEFMAAGGALARGNVSGSGLIGIALLNHFQNRRVGHTGILQFSEFFPGKHRQALRPAFRNGENDFIGKSSQAHRSSLTGPDAQLIELRKLQYGLFRRAGVKQIRDGLPVHEGLLMITRELDQYNAGWIAEARFVRLLKLSNFRIGNVQIFQLRDAVEPHAHLVGLLRVWLLGGLAGTYHYDRCQEQTTRQAARETKTPSECRGHSSIVTERANSEIGVCLED